MGTNFYWFKRKLEIDDNPCEGIHIGKNSCGWVFSFQAHPNLELESVDDYKKFLQEGYIYDEYGVLIPTDEFWEVVEASKISDDGEHPWSFYNCPTSERDTSFDKYSYTNRGFDFTIMDFC